MEPLLSLEQIFGRKYIMNSRSSYHNSRWLSGEASQDSSSGSLLTISGDVPLVCNVDVSTDDCLAILRSAKLPVGANLLIYKDQESYYRLLRELQNKGDRVVFKHAHLPGEFNESQYWIERDLLLYLNNKRNLGEIVPDGHAPRRILLPVDDFLNRDPDPASFEFPYVVKAATDEPSGGGFEVVICNIAADLEQARRLFRSCDYVVIEQFVAVRKNFCIQFAQTHTGETVYLGSAEQIITEEGKYAGNWIDMSDQPPAEAILLGERVMRKAAALGYLGFAGFDTIISEDNRIYIIDLNFRQNGSTAALLFKDSLASSWKAGVLKVRQWKIRRPFGEFRSMVETLVAQRRLLPLCVYNPAIQTADRPIFVLSALVGKSKEDVLESERQMLAMGFE